MITLKEEIFHGLPASKGISLGKPFIYKAEFPVSDIVTTGDLSVKKEIEEYKHAIQQSKKELSKIFELAKDKLNKENLQIFEAQFEFLNDEILHEKIIARIKAEKLPAYKVFNDEILIIEKNLLLSNDEYLRERVADVEDIKNRVLRNIVKKRLFSKIDENSIVIARSLTPSDTILFSNRNMLGFATDLGSINSHLAIIARSINIPAVVGMSDISSRIKPSDYLILDGYKGLLIKNPSSNTIKEYKDVVRRNIAFEKSLSELEKLPSETKDGKKIILSVNLEFNKEIDYVVTHAGCGVGLYRTEHLFLEKGDFPSEEEQYKQYKLLVDRLYPRTVTIRTFDIGGDKILPSTQKEANPFLGWRGIRICLEKTDIFMIQLRALLRASRRGNIRVMFPMISSLHEVLEIKKIIKKVKLQLKKKKIHFDEKIKFGIMIEVPSAVFIIDDLAKEVDFFSIGTNDLVQYLLAVDRDSSLISNLYQKFHPSVVRALNIIAENAIQHKLPISICGEMAGDPFASVLLIGLGIEELSVETTSFLRIKRLIRRIDYSEAKKIVENILKLKSENEIRETLAEAFRKLN